MHSKMRTKRDFPKLFPFISSLYHEELNDSTLSYIEDIQKDIDMDDFGELNLRHAHTKTTIFSSENLSIILYIWMCLPWVRLFEKLDDDHDDVRILSPGKRI